MAADQERADRIRALKQSRPDLTWRRIADYVGVTERSATDWQTKGGMEYANAKKLAELFEVDVDYVWRGRESDTPDLSLPHDGSDQMAGLQDQLRDVLGLLREARSEQDRISALLERQTAVLERIEQATRRADDAADRLDVAVAQAATALRSSPPAPKRAASKTAPKRTPRASR